MINTRIYVMETNRGELLTITVIHLLEVQRCWEAFLLGSVEGYKLNAYSRLQKGEVKRKRKVKKHRDRGKFCY